MTKKRLTTWLTGLYTVLLTTLCLVQFSVPSPEVPVIGFDKVVHFCLYALLNVLLIATIIVHKSKATAKHIIATTIASIAYGVVIEVVQRYVGRDFDLYDIMANALGSITAGILLSKPKISNLIRLYILRETL